MSRRKGAVLPALVLALLMSACSAETGTPVGEDLCGLYAQVSPHPFRADVPVMDAEPFVGKSEDEARALAERRGGTVRVVGEDGSCVDALSDDLANNRVNVYLDDGEVAEARTF